MEAVPRLPMISFELKVSPEAPSFGPKLKQYIRDFYHEDPETYGEEIRVLENLRASAVSAMSNPSQANLVELKRYYCQLHFLQSRFPMSKDGQAAVSFTWRYVYAIMVCTVPDIRFEMACVLYNIGAVHSYAGFSESRDTADGMKLACTHFQCAAWAFQHLKDTYSQQSSMDLAPDIMQFMYQLMLAQAQECILEKSMMDNRKATIIAKVAVQVVEYYKLALSVLEQGGSEDCSISETVGSKLYKSWKRYVRFKLVYHGCVSLLYQGQQAEEQQKMGERVALYQAASEKLAEAIKMAKGMDGAEAINEALTFTMDVVEGKKKAAKNENEFIYHEEVPDMDSLPEVKGASLVKGIAFDVNDPDVSGSDIFARLVPMKAHEASSLYSEEKAKLLRKVGAQIEEKDQELVTFMTSLQLDHLNLHPDMEHLPQELVDRCAALSAKPNAIQDLIDAMGKLADTYQDVESMLQEIRELLEQEATREQQYQALMGARPPSIAATDLTREARKYEEAHAKASESNQTLHKAMTLNISNLRILALPLAQLEAQIPSLRSLDVPLDEPVSQEMRRLVSKVEEMKSQRSVLASQLRESVCQDDITKQLVTRSGEPLDSIFSQELNKHNQYLSLIEQNLSAQDNILKALTDVYAKFAGTRKVMNEVVRRREATISSLISSYDAYEDLLAKSSKGVEFYRKLETNVSKLLQRVKGTCKVQDEEREHILAKNKKRLPDKKVADESTLEAEPAVPGPGAPKLKDYLESMKRGGGYPAAAVSPYLNPAYGHVPQSVSPQPVGPGSADNVGSSHQWVPSVRPAPVGSEETGEQSPSLCSGLSAAPKPADHAPEGKVIPPGYPFPSSFHTPYSTGVHYPSEMSSNKSSYSSNYHQQYPYDAGGQSYGYQLPEGSTPHRLSAFSQAAVPDGAANRTNPPAYQPVATTTDRPVAFSSPGQYAPVELLPQQREAGYYGYSSQSGTLYYPSQYAASYTSMQQAPVSYPCTPSQQPGAVYCMTGQLGTMYPTSTSASSTTDIRPPQESYGQVYGYDSTGYLPPSGATEYKYMSMDANVSSYTSAGNCDTSQTCSSNKSVDGQTFAAQYGASVKQDAPAQSEYYTSLYSGYQYHGSAGQQSAVVSQYQSTVGQQQAAVSQQQATVGQQQGVYNIQQAAVGQQQAVGGQQAAFGQQQGSYAQQAAVGQQQGSYAQQAAVGQQQGSYAQQAAVGQQQGSYAQQAAVGQQQGSYGLQQAAVGQQQGSYIQQQAAVGQQQGSYGQQQAAVGQQGSYGQQHVAVGQQQGSYDQQQAAVGQQQGIYGQQPGSYELQQAAVGQQQGSYGLQQAAIGQLQGSYGLQQATVGQLQGSYGQQQGSYGQQPGSYGQQQGIYGQQQAAIGQQVPVSNQQVSFEYQQGSYGQQQVPVGQQQATSQLQPSVGQQPTVVQQQGGNDGQQTVVASNVDLLAGLDFSVSQAPLVPQQPSSGEKVAAATTVTSPSKQPAVSLPKLTPSAAAVTAVVAAAPTATSAASVEPGTSSTSPLLVQSGKEEQRETAPAVTTEVVDARAVSGLKTAGKEPYLDPESLAQFVQEVEKYEKFVEGLTTKTLNGPTPLDMKWKELMDLQEKDSNKHSISVARCYPMKNRFPDILPYDDSRVELPSTKDDYINASYVKDVSPLTPQYIVTQAPLPSTYCDFWTMVWEQQVEVVVCLLSNAELDEETYWPVDRSQELLLGGMKLSLQSSNTRPHWTERILSLTVGETRSSRVVAHLQFTAWPGSSFPASPGPFLGFVSEALGFQQQQRVSSHPVVVHCLSGVGRTGLFVLTTAAVCEVQAGRGLPDLVAIAAALSSHRKNSLRDREHLRFAYQTLLYYAQDMLMKRGILTSHSSFEDKRSRGGKSHTRHPSEDFLLGPPTDLSQLQSGVEKMGLGAGSSSDGPRTEPRGEAAAEPRAAPRTMALSKHASRRYSRDSFEDRQKPLEASVTQPGDPFGDIDPLWPLKRL